MASLGVSWLDLVLAGEAAVDDREAASRIQDEANLLLLDLGLEEHIDILRHRIDSRKI